MNGRLIIAVVTTLLDEAVLVFLLVWGLSKLGISLPVAVLVLIGILWTVFAVVLYVSGTKVLREKPMVGQTDMTGSNGKVIKDLTPEGMVKISGELWSARSTTGNIHKDEKIEVTGQEGLTLVVKKASNK
jgi:membrane-bound serine protease (ClpP class)